MTGRAWRTLLRRLWLAATVVAVAVVLVSRWDEIQPSLAGMSPGVLAAGMLGALIAVGASAGIWRALMTGLGTPLPLRPAARVFFVGQIGKYLPGGLWPALAQVALGRAAQVPPRVSAAAVVWFLWVHLLTGALVAVVSLPLAGGLSLAWLLLAPVIAVLLLPALAGNGLAWLLARLGREPLPRLPDAAAVGRAVGWALLMWAAYGAHVAVLAAGSGAPADLLRATGAFAAAWCIGFLMVVAPAGAGVREAVLVLLLALPAGAGLVVALVSRAAVVVADALWALVAEAFAER